MSQQRRLIIEIVAALFLILICIGVWNLTRTNCDRQLAEQESRHESALTQMRQDSEARAQKLAVSEATSVFRAFAAGIQAATLGQQRGMLDVAKGSLLGLPYVAFVHVLTPEGKVLTSSNEKYTVAGQADDRASWALQATDLQARTGDLPGTIEIAAPFQGASGRVAVLWLGYKTEELLGASGTESAPTSSAK